jgi:hypothetical protein
MMHGDVPGRGGDATHSLLWGTYTINTVPIPHGPHCNNRRERNEASQALPAKAVHREGSPRAESEPATWQ